MRRIVHALTLLAVLLPGAAAAEFRYRLAVPGLPAPTTAAPADPAPPADPAQSGGTEACGHGRQLFASGGMLALPAGCPFLDVRVLVAGGGGAGGNMPSGCLYAAGAGGSGHVLVGTFRITASVPVTVGRAVGRARRARRPASAGT